MYSFIGSVVGARRLLTIVFALLASRSMAAEPIPRDAEISNAVEREILFDESVRLEELDVHSSEGIVTLTGTVDNLLAKERATRIARTVKGVESVVNRVAVRPATNMNDTEIRDDVKRALMHDPATDSYEIAVIVQDGEVTLEGDVQSWQEAELSGLVAKSVRGVRKVHDRLDVHHDTDRPDDEILAEVEQALKFDVFVDDDLIDVAVTDSAVTLIGTVGSAAERFRATTNAWVGGVKAVDDSALTVEPWARDDDLREHKYVHRTDAQIEDAIQASLQRDPRVSSFDVDIEVARGHVKLSGTVDHLGAKRAAEQDARNTVGVYRVQNDILVRPMVTAHEERIRNDVMDALRRDPVVESFDVDVDVESSTVVLSGTVGTYYEKFHADDLVSRVSGVVDVQNDLDVEPTNLAGIPDPYVDSYYYPYGYRWLSDAKATSPAERMTDGKIKAEIESELWWSPFVDSEDVEVSVREGVATLTGVVESWAEAGSAVENAYEGGALHVNNELLVTPPVPAS